jgi:hypothetical protein
MLKEKRFLLAAAVVVALVASPFAFAAGEGKPLLGGKRNPSQNQTQELAAETEIIANNATYGTRQSNKSNNGGGAIYGCRSGEGGSPKDQEPCIRANNLSTGLAFEYATEGTLGGTILSQKPGDGSKPFTTNATGVATGLNADRVDSKGADDIVKDALAAASALTSFAQVAADGTLGSQRGVASVRKTGLPVLGAGEYEVVFREDVSKCALTATQSTNTDSGAVSVTLGTDKKTAAVVTRNNGGTAADRPFHVTATC